MLMSIKLRTNNTNNTDNIKNINNTNNIKNIKNSIREIRIMRRVSWVELGRSWAEGKLGRCNGNMRLIMKELMYNDYLCIVYFMNFTFMLFKDVPLHCIQYR